MLTQDPECINLRDTYFTSLSAFQSNYVALFLGIPSFPTLAPCLCLPRAFILHFHRIPSSLVLLRLIKGSKTVSRLSRRGLSRKNSVAITKVSHVLNEQKILFHQGESLSMNLSQNSLLELFDDELLSGLLYELECRLADAKFHELAVRIRITLLFAYVRNDLSEVYANCLRGEDKAFVLLIESNLLNGVVYLG